MSPKVPKAYRDARRAEIQAAAVKCFMEKGFHNTTMQDIYEATGLSPGAVYNYFSSKEDIIVAAVKDFNDWSISSLETLTTNDPADSLMKYIRFWLSIIKQKEYRTNISVYLDLYSEATRNNDIREAVLKIHDTIHARLIELVKQNQRLGLFNPRLDPLAIARAIMSMLFGITIHKALEPEVDVDTFEQVCEAIIQNAFATPPTKRRKTSQLLSKINTAEKEYLDKHKR